MRTFHVFNREFEYYQELGERTVEIPLALAVYGDNSPVDIVEVGYVLARQLNDRNLFPNRTKHRVIDLFETHPDCENIDAGTFDYHGYFVLSVSTLEHMDMPDHGNTNTGGNRGVDCLVKILKESSGYFITWPLGYNKPFDQGVRDLGIDVLMMKQANGPTNEKPEVLPVWVKLSQPDWTIEYGQPFHYGNSVAIVTNVPWIMNHEVIHRRA